MLPFNLTRRIANRSGSGGFGTIVAGLALSLLCTGVATAQENPDPSLNGVSRSFIEANGLPASVTTSARGLNQEGAPQIPRSGFDIINDGTTGTVLLRGVRALPNGSCAGLTDDAFILVHVAGRPGDADGDGSFNSNAGPCAARRSNNPVNPKIIDGTVSDVGVVTFGENLRLRFDRDCNGKADLVISLNNSAPNLPTQLRVESDDYTGTAGTVLGGQGVAWEAALFPGDSFASPCPDPAGINGYYILRLVNFSQYFAVVGLNPGDFGFVITAGSDDDGLGEDLIEGSVRLSEPQLAITKEPNLALCPNAEGNWTIVVTNNGNAPVTGIVVTDVLPAGVTLQSVVSGGVTPSGNTGSITFSPFDLGQCESRTIVIRVRADANCSGGGVNSASAAGVFSTFCGTEPGTLAAIPVMAGPATANFTCLPGPCVTVTCTPNVSSACPGTPVQLTVRGTNCSDGPARIRLKVGVQSFECPDPIPAGGFCEHTFTVTMPACTAGQDVTFPSQATATNDCTSTTVITPNPCSVRCAGPAVGIDKSAEIEVQAGGKIHYLITVTNESQETDLTNVVVTDNLCAYVSGPANFGGTCAAGAPNVNGTTITWPAFNLAKNSSCTLTFEVTAVGNATPCTETVSCRNNVSVTAQCGSASDPANDFADTVIRCTVVRDNCPRTAGFWGAQCAQLPDGSAKLTPAEVEDVAECVDDQSTFFDWSAGTDFSRFCQTITLPSDPTQRQQAKRQFAVLLANLCTGLLGISPNNGGIIGIDPSTPLSCPGFAATTIGELLVEVDALLASLEGQSLTSSVKNRYSQIISCVDALNRGVNIVTDRGRCENGDGNRIGASGTKLHGEGEILHLDRPTPNPFRGSMSYSYRVPDGTDSRVDVGVYNVAGRLIARLARGAQAPGPYTVRWDGTSDDGIKMAPGVYFLRASVAGQVNRTRVLYVSP